MIESELYEKIRPWVKPGLTILLGLILLFRPDSLTTMLAVGIGIVVALIGAALMLSFFFGHHQKDGLRLAGAVILLVLGLSIIKTPLSLASQIGRFIGILLVLQSARQLTDELTIQSKSMSAISGVVGLVLMLVPLSSFRLLGSVCGIVVLIIGIGLALDTWHNHNSKGSGKDTIIDV